VQNRCFARFGWDAAVRAVCRDKDIVCQEFSLLTANVNELHHPELLRIAARLRKTPAQIVFRFVRQIGILPLTGTTNVDHMRQDLEIDRFELSAADVDLIENISRAQ
jgi:diketogulonate reductase-like aldo/keto reductase